MKTLKLSAITLALGLSFNAHSAPLTVGVATDNTTMQGNNTTVTSRYTTTISGGSLGLGGTHVLIGGTGKNTVITGNSTNITTTTTNIGVTGGNVTVTGLNTNLNASNININGIDTRINNQKTTMSGALVVGAIGDTRTGQNGIYQLNSGGTTAARIDRNGTLSIIGTGGTEANPVFNVDGKSGVLTSKADIRTTGVVTANGINNSNKTITNLADGVNNTDAVNVRQLNAEATARINGDVNTLNQANNYTNTQVNNAVGQANNYTDNRVNAETQRAMQAERELSNHINAVGAMAMAVGSMPRTAYNPDRKSRLNLGIGNYGNATAMAVGLSHDFNDRISGNLNVAQSITGNGNSGVGAGLSIGF
jgi:hypothetical protein